MEAGEGLEGWMGRMYAAGEQQKVLIAVDLGAGQPVSTGYVDEHDLLTAFFSLVV